MPISVSTALWTDGVRPKVEQLNDRFPDFSWGTYGGHHPTRDRATDGMVPRYLTEAGKARGWEVARWIWANRKALGVWYVIFDARIISETNPGAGWKVYYPTADAIRNSPDSAYHRNHVHVSFYDIAAPVKTLPVYVVDPDKISTTLTANAPAGKTDQQRPPGFEITTGVRIFTGDDGNQWLETLAKYRYRLDFLVLRSEFEARPKPAPEVSKPAPEPEPSKPTFRKVAFLNLPGTGNWQGCSLAGKDWYAVEARKRSDGSEDCFVYRLVNQPDNDNLKPSEDPMQLNASPGNKVHPTGWGVSDSGTLWVTWNGEGTGNDVVTVDYEPGKVVTKAQTRPMHVFSEGNIQIAFDESNEVCSTRQITTGYDTHILRSKQDVLDGVDKPLGRVRIPRRPNRIVQGFTVAKNDGGNWELRVLCGLKSAGSPFVIERWSFVKGTGIATIEIPESLGREPEGIDGEMVGFKTADREGLDVFRYTV